MSSEDDEPIHFVEDLEERANAAPVVTTMAVGEEGGITMSCAETGC